MYNIKLSGLDTGQQYYVKVRAKVNGLETSEWSMPFKFRAPKDTMPPGRIENLSFLSEGDSFVSKWDAPTINEDGSPCADVSHYTLEIKDLDRNVTVNQRTVETAFSFDFNQNKNMFGIAAGRIELTVRAVDLSGNIGKPVTAIAQNPPPQQVKNVSAASGLESIHLSWTENSDTDLKHYEVHAGPNASFTPSESTMRATIAPGNSTFLYDSASLSVVFIKILAVDKFNQKSIPSDVVSAQPRLTTDYDKEPPPGVPGLTVEQVLAPDSASAIAHISFTPLTVEDLDKYEVQYRKSGDTSVPWSFTTIPSDQPSAEIGPLPLDTDYDFKIRAVDYNSNKGVWSSTVVAAGVKKTSLPPAPTGIAVRGGFTNLMITWNESVDQSMSNWSGTYEVQIYKDSGPGVSGISIKTSSTLASFINLEANTVYYARVRSIDPYGNIGAWSAPVTGNTGSVSDNAARVFAGNTAPANNASNALKANDLWIRDSDKRMHRWTGTAWEIAQDYRIEGSALKGNNLIFNGHGELDSLIGWNNFSSYSKSDAPPGSAGSFITDSKQTVRTTDLIPVNPYQNYTLSFWARQVSAELNKSYGFIAPYDAFGNSIQPTNYMYRSGSTTQLTAELKPGDTEIKVASTANWYVGTGTNYYVTFWDYVDAGGKTWPKETYTRNFHSRPYDANVSSLPANSIPLSSPWNGPVKPVGTWLSSGMSGGSYMYHGIAGLALTPEWTFYKSATIGGIHDVPESAATRKFPIATAYVAVGFLTNFTVMSGSVQAYAGIDFSDVNAAQDMADSAMTTATGRNRVMFRTIAPNTTTYNGQPFIDGDIWYRRDANDTIIGMWEFQSGSWISKTLNNQVIANLDAGKINAGTISADRIGSRSISANKLQISDSTNLIPGDSLDIVDGWRLTRTEVKSAEDYNYVEFNTSGQFNTMVTDVFGVQPGEYLIEFDMKKTSGTSGSSKISIHLETQTLSGDRASLITSGSSVSASTEWTKYSGSVTVPSGIQRARLWLETTTGNHGVDVRYLVVKKKTGETLIENGAITTGKIAAEAVTATELAADSVIAGKIKAGEITGDKLAVNAAIVNNLKIQSSIEINSAGGHIKSSNYSPDGSAGFYMDQQQLIINQGKIKAAALEIQDSQNMLAPVFAGLNHSAKIYEDVIGSADGGTYYYWPNSGKGYNGAIAHEGHNTTLLLSPISVAHYTILQPGQKYIISGYMRIHSDGIVGSASASLGLYILNIGSESSGTFWSPVVTSSSTNEYIRAQIVFEPSEECLAMITLKNNGSTDPEVIPVWSSFQIERVMAGVEIASPWTPPGSTVIDGESIVTGSISSRDTVSTANGDIALWSIDTWGKARFADATIDGKLVVGGRVGADNVNTYIQSDSYLAGSSGWAIKGNGDAEFNDGTFRGVLNLGRLTGEAVRPTMTVSVSSIELFTDATSSKDIDVASIQGTTYAYSRVEDPPDSGIYLPVAPNSDKSARYFIGPTTDRSVNIQVHDSDKERAVYLDNAPENVTLSSVKIGELTNTSSAPLEREKQGFGHVTQRAETDPSSPDKVSAIKIEQDSSVRLRSASYPEISGGNEYPDSTHRLTTSVNFKAPDNKNMLSAATALPGSTAPNSIARESSQSYSARAYPLHNDFTKSTFMTFNTLAGSQAMVGKKHVFSTYVDANDATDPVAVYAFMGSTPLKPISGGMESGQTEYQHSVNYNSPDYRYEFETNSASYTNLGSGSAALTRTTGSGYLSPAGALYSTGNMRYTATENYSINQGMSISMWIMPTSTSGAAQVIFHRAADTSREIWINYEPNSRTFSGGLNTGTAWTWAATNNLVGDGWTHVTFVIPPANSTTRYMRIYINGEERWVSDAIPTNRFNLAFGTQPYYLFGNMQLNSFYSGAISEPMIYKRVLTAEQVNSIFHSGNKVVYFSGGRTTLSQNGILVSPGREERVAFEYNPTVSNESPLTVQTVSTRGGVKTYIYKLQLERAKYMDNEGLPLSIRENLAPTPWTTDGSIATAGAELTLKSTPAPDQASWSIGAQTSSEVGARNNQQAADRSTASEMQLTLASSYRSSLNASTEQSVSTTYKWTSAGMSYPGTNIPYMPTAAAIEWNYQDLPAASRPQIGGSTNWSTVINSSALTGQINIGNGLPIRDRFERSGAVGNLGPNWINTGNVKMEIVDSVIRRRNNNASQANGITDRWVTSAQELGSFEQEMEVDLSDSTSAFERWPANVSVLLSLDPNTNSRVEFRYIDWDPQRVEIFVVINGQIAWSHQSTVSGGRVTSWTKFSFTRANRTLTIKRNGGILRSVTVPSNITMPDGKNVGFNIENGRLDNLSAYDRAPGAASYGLLRPESINVNNSRGIKVGGNGSILIEAPGWYVVSGLIAAEGTFGGNDSRDYWLEVHYNNAGRGGSYALSGQYNSTTAIPYISGTHLCHLQGYVTFVARSNTTTTGRISHANFNIARVM